jgi:hypothetical protein
MSANPARAAHPPPILPGGAIKAPVYRHGVTKPSDWKVILSSSLAPWGEMGSSKFIISTPKTSLAKVVDPAALMNYWDKVGGGCNVTCMHA